MKHFFNILNSSTHTITFITNIIIIAAVGSPTDIVELVVVTPTAPFDMNNETIHAIPIQIPA